MIRSLFFIGVVFIMIGVVKNEESKCESGVQVVSLPYDDFKKADIINNI